MLLEIKKINENKFIAKFANEEIEISEQSQDWNIEWINKFLIKLASKTPTNEKIELKFNDQEKNKVYLHLIDFFKNLLMSTMDRMLEKGNKSLYLIVWKNYFIIFSYEFKRLLW